jgi:hypothetical protein
MGTWLLSMSQVVVPMRFATKHCFSGRTARSLLAAQTYCLLASSAGYDDAIILAARMTLATARDRAILNARW